jgi:hypothetical protein
VNSIAQPDRSREVSTGAKPDLDQQVQQIIDSIRFE